MNHAAFRIRFLAALLTAVLTLPGLTQDLPAAGQESWYLQTPDTVADFLRIQNRLEELLPDAEAATVAIVGRGAGSGVIVSSEGLVFTAAHMIRRAGESIQIILPDGRSVRARTLGALRFPDAGMAQIDEDGPWPFVPIADGNAAPGEWCFALGHPGGFDKARGQVVRVGRVISIRSRSNSLRTDCKIISGDSGGPLFNLDGKLIGIHSRIAEDSDENFHVAARVYQENREKLLAGTVFPRRTRQAGGFLGVHTQRHSEGIEVLEVVGESAAAKAELVPGDIILSVEGNPINDTDEFAAAISSYRPGEMVQLSLRRAGKTIEREIRLGARPRDD